jgi:outer membrane protein OmpA-like peptidoglycan-associated protein
MKTKHLVLPTALLLSMACASSRTSSQLETARTDYRTATSGPASELELAALDDAKEALNRAEVAHADDPGSYKERSLAYLASHKARIAMAKAGEADAKLTIEQAKERHDEYEKAVLAAQRNALQQTTNDLEQERQARQEAEKRAQAALASLREFASVQQDERGMVLTLSGSVLFATAKSELLSTARQRLDDIARTLVDLEADVQFRIEGHTDSRGTEQYNEQLSQERAQSVADYLVSQGLDAKRIDTVGLGESEPVASNDTPEGRANNRRVEIVIQDPDAKNKRGEMSRDADASPGQSGIPDER